MEDDYMISTEHKLQSYNYIEVFIPYLYKTGKRLDKLDIPNSLKFSGNNGLRFKIKLDIGKVTRYKEDKQLDLFLKVRDMGTYSLISDNHNFPQLTLFESYVPEILLINSHDSDYLDFRIDENGYIVGWNFDKNKAAKSFIKQNED